MGKGLMLLDKGSALSGGFVELIRNITFPGFTTGLIGATFSASIGLGIIISVAQEGGLPEGVAVSWIFITFLCAGLATMFVSLQSRTPVVIAWSIPGAVLIGKYLAAGGNIHDAAGVYIAISVAVLVLTATGLIKLLIEHIPVPIMLGMVAGVLLSFGVGTFTNAMKEFSVYGVMVVVFFIWSFFKGLSNKIPSVIVAAAVGAVLLKVLGEAGSIPVAWEVATPLFISPHFNLTGFLTLGIPLFFMVVGVQNIQAVGVLISRGYTPPVNTMYTVPSVITFFNAIMCGHTAVTAGPNTAIVSSVLAGKKEYRWIAAFVDGLFWVMIGLGGKDGSGSRQTGAPPVHAGGYRPGYVRCIHQCF
ncbi:MAG: benzoate/H(+) symporter BenE family transporter [Firmicutes bacterium]|nr:benzoate/H(+) symporter BenE family transporter [Bacillota bacterium]